MNFYWESALWKNSSRYYGEKLIVCPDPKSFIFRSIDKCTKLTIINAEKEQWILAFWYQRKGLLGTLNIWFNWAQQILRDYKPNFCSNACKRVSLQALSVHTDLPGQCYPVFLFHIFIGLEAGMSGEHFYSEIYKIRSSHKHVFFWPVSN